MNICYQLSPENHNLRGQDMTIYYGFHKSPVGRMLIARSGNYLIWLGIDSPEGELLKEFPAAKFVHDESSTAALANEICRAWRLGRDPFIHVMLYGTTFQHRVWEALRAIPPGKCCSYSDLARQIDMPNAARAVGKAVGSNPVCVLIPCHRVVGANGDLHGYRWGLAIKQELLEKERLVA